MISLWKIRQITLEIAIQLLPIMEYINAMRLILVFLISKRDQITQETQEIDSKTPQHKEEPSANHNS